MEKLLVNKLLDLATQNIIKRSKLDIEAFMIQINHYEKLLHLTYLEKPWKINVVKYSNWKKEIDRLEKKLADLRIGLEKELNDINELL